MCRLATAEFDATTSAVPMARRFVASHLVHWELPELADMASLLTSELVTNAVVHAGSRPRVVLAVADGSVEVGVTDESRLPSGGLRPTLLTNVEGDQGLAVHGRGLLLVDAIASAWDATELAQGKQVWFRLDAAGWIFRSACGCLDEVADRVCLGSGRYAVAIPGPWDELPPSLVG